MAAAVEGRRSRIPVPCRLHPKPSAELQMTFPSKRKCVSSTSKPEFSTVPCLNFASNVPADTILKSAHQGLSKSTKRVEPVSQKTVARLHLTRYQLEAELKNKNQLVEALKQQLARKEGTVQKLKKEIERWDLQETFMMILESRNINPESNIEEEKETCASQKKVTMFTKKTLEELMLICHTLAKEKEMLEAAKAKWKSALEENQCALESCFQAQIKEWTARLEELAKLLAM